MVVKPNHSRNKSESGNSTKISNIENYLSSYTLITKEIKECYGCQLVSMKISEVVGAPSKKKKVVGAKK